MPDVEGIRGKILRTEPGGILVVQVAKDDRDYVKPFFAQYMGRAKKKAIILKRDIPILDDMPILSFNFAYWYRKRTLDQNALYWALLTILSFEVYGEYNHEDELHEEILAIYSPRIEGALTRRPVPKRSKELTTVEFSRLVEGVFKELAEHGVSVESGSRIIGHWREWQEWRGRQEKDPLADDYKGEKEYKERIPYCEACLKYIGDAGGGSIAHIVSRGAGGSSETDNLLHLCDTDHVLFQHAHGWEAFLEKYPHLRWKVETARGDRSPEGEESVPVPVAGEAEIPTSRNRAAKEDDGLWAEQDQGVSASGQADRSGDGNDKVDPVGIVKSVFGGEDVTEELDIF